MAEAKRINAGEAPLLVCAYDEPDKAEQAALEGALSMERLVELKPALSKEVTIAFYCQ